MTTHPLRLAGVSAAPSATRYAKEKKDRSDLRWQARFGALETFLASNGRRPRFDAVDIDERSLAGWLNHQQVSRNAGRLSAERCSMLERVAPLAQARRTKSFEERVTELAAFYEEYGRLPRNSVEGEKSLSQWLLSERMRFKRDEMHSSRIAALETIPRALATRTNAKTDAMMSSASAWCAEHGRLPRTSFSTTRVLTQEEEREKQIAQWMRNHARAGVTRRETAESSFRRDAIRELYAEYPTPAAANALRQRDRVRDVLERLNYLPPGSDEPEVHAWLARQRRIEQNGEALEPESAALMDLASTLPSAADFKLLGRVAELEEFVADNDRLPGFAQSADAEEKSLAFWLKRRMDGTRATGGLEINSRIWEITAAFDPPARQTPARSRSYGPDLLSALDAQVLSIAGWSSSLAEEVQQLMEKERAVRSICYMLAPGQRAPLRGTERPQVQKELVKMNEECASLILQLETAVSRVRSLEL